MCKIRSTVENKLIFSLSSAHALKRASRGTKIVTDRWAALIKSLASVQTNFLSWKSTKGLE